MESEAAMFGVSKFFRNILIVATLLACVLLSQVVRAERYIYPVGYGSDAFKSMTSEEKIESCVIPESILSGMTTAEVVEACMEYPLRNIYMFHSPLSAGVDRLFVIGNCFQELERRADSGSELIRYYGTLSPIATGKIRSAEDISTASTWSLVELLLARAAILSSLDSTQLDELLTTLMASSAHRFQVAKPGRDVLAYLMGRALLRALENPNGWLNKRADGLVNYLEDGGGFRDSYAGVISESVQQYLSGSQ